MSFPNTPPEGINPIEGLDAEQIALLLLASIAFEELGLAHVINAEAEKLQGAIGTLVDENGDPVNPSIQAGSLAELLAANREVERMLRTVIKKEMLLEFKFENVLDLIGTLPCQPMIQMTTTNTANPCVVNTTGTVTCSRQLVSSPVTITFNLFLNGVPAGQFINNFPNGNFNTGFFIFGAPFTGVLTIVATTTVNGETVSTSNSINIINCVPGAGVAGSGESVIVMQSAEATQMTLDGGCDCLDHQ
ncbi:hypothetical protein [Peribacillus butanolivorans]|uniref:hypothetical protein n=1 Tax=Peribacillus butanolivorans TaxID=421767 RepID=UPI00382DA287